MVGIRLKRGQILADWLASTFWPVRRLPAPHIEVRRSPFSSNFTFTNLFRAARDRDRQYWGHYPVPEIRGYDQIRHENSLAYPKAEVSIRHTCPGWEILSPSRILSDSKWLSTLAGASEHALTPIYHYIRPKTLHRWMDSRSCQMRTSPKHFRLIFPNGKFSVARILCLVAV